MDPFLDAYHSLAELLTLVEPAIVAYISHNDAGSGGIAGPPAAWAKDVGGDGVVVAALEAAMRSTSAPRRPVALPLPDTVEGAEAAKVGDNIIFR